MTQVARNDNVRLMPLQFPPPGMQTGPPPGMQNGPPPSVSTAPLGSFFSMNVECGAYLPPHLGMTDVEAPPPYASS